MFIKILTGVYCIFRPVFCVSHPVCQMYYICYQDLLFWICYNVHEEPHCDVLHLRSSILHIPPCALGASLGCTAIANKCTAYAATIMYIRSLTWVYDISHQVSYRVHHVHQEPHLGALHLPTDALQCQQAHCISHQVYCRGHLLTSEATLGCTSGASLGCTAETII